jgi:hypothetical protein
MPHVDGQIMANANQKVERGMIGDIEKLLQHVLCRRVNAVTNKTRRKFY